MKNKTNGKCALFIFDKSKNCFLVDLKENEQAMVLNLVTQIQDGTIKIFKEKFPITYTKK